VSPPYQLAVHYIVGRSKLQSAVRLSRHLALPSAWWPDRRWRGAAVRLRPGLGIIINALIYLPLVVVAGRAPSAPHKPYVAAKSAKPRPCAAWRIFWTPRRGRRQPHRQCHDPAGRGASLLVGNFLQAQMPGFAKDLGHGHADLSYSSCGADAAAR